MSGYYNICIWHGIEPQLRGPYSSPEEQLAAAQRTWDDDMASREDDSIVRLMIGADGEPEVAPYARGERDARLDDKAVRATDQAVDRMREPFLPLREILDEVADQITSTAMCCHEALREYWERNDEGFEAMRNGLENALRVLGYPMPDYAERDREWLEMNGPWDESEEDDD